MTRRFRRVGHKGADLIAPGNTLASFDAALRSGVDMIEFDVLSENRDGTGALLLAHDYTHADGALTLEEGLDHFCQEHYATTELDVDLKLTGYEDRVVAALRERGLLTRALVSTMEPQSLPRLRELEPMLRIGQSVPKVKRNHLAHWWSRPLAYLVIGWLRWTLPRRLSRAVGAGEIDAVMAHRSVVTRRFADMLHAAGGELYVWTVDDAGDIARFESLGVDGVISNDPRLFGARRAT